MWYEFREKFKDSLRPIVDWIIKQIIAQYLENKIIYSQIIKLHVFEPLNVPISLPQINKILKDAELKESKSVILKLFKEYHQGDAYLQIKTEDLLIKIFPPFSPLIASRVSRKFSTKKFKLEQLFTTSLKFEKIVEVDLSDNIYEEVIKEINGTYIDHYFASMYIMVRKLLENSLYDCLKKYYDTDVDKYFNTIKSQHQGFGTLIDNFNIMIKEIRFKTDIGDVEQQFIDLLKEFQENYH